MKSIVLLFSLLLILTLSSCSNEDNPVPASEPDPIEKLNMRTIELFGQGTDAAEAAETIKKEFPYEDKVLLLSLYAAGYSPGDVTKAIHIAYDYNPRLAEPVLVEIMKNKTAADIADLILKEYITELKSHPADLKYFINEVNGLENKIIILNEIYEIKPASMLILLMDSGEDVTETIQLLIKYFPLVEEDIKNLMLQAGCSCAEIAGVLKVIYNHTLPEILQFLNENGYQLVESLTALKGLFNLSTLQITELLEDLGYKADDIAAVLKDLQYTNMEIAVVLNNHFNYSAEETASLLKNLNTSIEDVADILMDVYDRTVPESVVILYNIDFSVDEIFFLLRDHIKMGIQDIIDLLAALGIDRCTILQIIHIPCY